MSKFFNASLIGEFVGNARTFVLTRTLIFTDGEFSVTVPEGFVTDFNSVPRGLWNFFPPWEHPEAGVVHDFLYRFPAEGLTRAKADSVHRRILEVTGCGLAKRWLAYYALRTFGWVAWRNSRRSSLPPVRITAKDE